MNEQVMEMIAEAARLGSTELDLSGQGLTELPQGIKFLTELRDLDLSNNQLSILSDEIGSLTNLEVLNLSDNQLSILPDPITFFTNLYTLNLEGNQFTDLPDAIITSLYEIWKFRSSPHPASQKLNQ